MKLVWRHTKSGTLELLRLPSYLIPTLSFPVMFYIFFGLPNSRKGADPNIYLGSFSAFAVLGVLLFQFGVGIAVVRDSPWERYLRTLPVGLFTRFTARIFSAAAFALAAFLAVLLVAALAAPVELSIGMLLRLLTALLVGGVPFALMGIAIGYWSSPKAALPIANIIYLPLSLAGGLWSRPDALPDWIKTVAPYLPTGRWAHVVWAASTGQSWSWQDWTWLAAFGVLCGAVAALGYRRDEGKHYR